MESVFDCVRNNIKTIITSDLIGNRNGLDRVIYDTCSIQIIFYASIKIRTAQLRKIKGFANILSKRTI